MGHKNGSSKSKHATPRVWHVPCRVEPGMFNGEWLVRVQVVNGNNPNETCEVQLFADESDVVGIRGNPERHAPVPAYLKVSVVHRGGGIAEVVFPQPAQPVGERAFMDADVVREGVGA